ncbi:eukaryotic translation initiation factor 4 gamma 2 [Cydia fagiglandana]|uniref:eukaryotic translation initiation factor 4 gamma 2 n=1 Tax=Cydia fagiglandana TaxID=1458189 RepID=UPI002FEDF2B5
MPVPLNRRRWVPPSSLREHDVPDGDAKHDTIFRKVRGILNKLTPEKFQKLSDDLLGLELDSDKVLKGVILLIFEKALDEPKYSSMYAQLCKRLSEEAPNLEPPGQPCTFRLLLLNKCRAEFENRAQAFAAFEERALAPEEEERRHLAKCKMLGNIKFIGELGKLEILAESILHRCIQNLLARRAAADHHEDLECLAQLVRTCGRVLDSERGRGLMDQYFARIETLSHSQELQPRIRFMLRDVVELRRGGWVPRAATSHEGPVPIQQLRPDASPPRRQDREPRDSLFRGGLRSRPLDDVLAGLALQPAGSLVPPPDKLFGNGFPSRDGFRQRSAPSAPQGYYHHNRQHYKQGRDQQGNGKQEAPRLHKARLAAGGALEDVQMRPAAYSLMFTASANRLPKQPAPPPLLLPPAPQKTLAGGALIKEPAITIKPAPDKKDKPKKDKGLNKEEACRLLIEAATAAAAAVGEAGEAGAGDDDAALQQHVQKIRDAALPDKLLRRAIQALLEHTLAHEAESEAAWARLCSATMALVRGVKRSSVGEALRALPTGGRLAALLAHAVRHKLLSLGELGGWGEAGAPQPLLLDVLQRLQEQLGAAAAAELCAESKLNVCAAAAGAADAGGALAALEARGLAHLAPALQVQAQLARQLQAEPAPAHLYRWIKGNVEPSVRQNAAFVSTLVALIAGHVTAAAGCEAAQDKAALEREKALAEAYAPLLTALLQGRADLQLAAVYAVQLHAHHHRYPKGMLLRWFMYLYNLEVCEEDAFLRWREDVTDAYPGKGEALFQVNTWLTWLQQQESEDEEAED